MDAPMHCQAAVCWSSVSDWVRVFRCQIGPERGVDLADDCTFEAADDLLLGFSLGGAALNVGSGGRVPAQSVDHDEVYNGISCTPILRAISAIELPESSTNLTACSLYSSVNRRRAIP